MSTLTIKTIVPALLCALVVLFVSGSVAYADAENVTITSGMVAVNDDGSAIVLLANGRRVVPSNLFGLLRSGQVEPFEVVDVKIVAHPKHKHRGHVTVLK